MSVVMRSSKALLQVFIYRDPVDFRKSHRGLAAIVELERYRRREASIEEAPFEMYLADVSVRRGEYITEALWGTCLSSGTVSKLNQKVYKHIEK